MLNQLAVQGGRKDSGSNCIHADVVGSQFDGQRFGQGAYSRFADPISRYLIEGNEVGERPDVQDFAEALSDHRFAEDLASPPGTVQVYVNDAIPALFSAFEGRRLERDSGGVDQDVDLPETLKHPLG